MVAGRRRSFGCARAVAGGDGDGAEAGGEGRSGRGWRERWWSMGEVVTGDQRWRVDKGEKPERDHGGGEDKGESAARGGVR